MDEYGENPNSKRLKLLAGLVILAIVVLVLLAIFDHHSQPKPIAHNQKTNPALHVVSQKYSVSNTFAQAVAYENDTMLLSDGQAFVSYNYTNTQTKLLSPNTTSNYLAGVDSLGVSANGQYILFHQQIALAGGKLATILQQAGDNASLSYWWVYDQKSQNFQPLPQDVLLAKFAGNTVDALSFSDSSETITSYTASNLHQLSTTPIPGSSDFFPLKSGFLLQSPTGNVLLNKGGAVNQTLFTSTTIAGVLPNQALAVGVVKNKNDRQLESLNLNTDSASIVAKNIQNSPVWLASGTTLYITAASVGQAPSFYEYDVGDNQNKALDFSQALGNTGAANLNPIAIVGDATAIVQATSGNYYLIGNQLAANTLAAASNL